MADSATERAQAFTLAAGAAKDLDPHQATAISGVIPPPGESTTKVVWIVAVGGLVALLAIALGGLIYLLAEGKTTDLVLTAFTALLTGLIGLFSPSPVKS